MWARVASSSILPLLSVIIGCGSNLAGRMSNTRETNPAGGVGVGRDSGGRHCRPVPEFANWPTGKSPIEIGQLLVTNYLGRNRGEYHYADACAWFGALRFSKVIGDNARSQALLGQFDHFLGDRSYYPLSGKTVDDRVGGIVPLEIFIETRDTNKSYRTTGLKPADDQYAELTANLASARYWVDDMFMITALQLQASRASGDSKYREFAANAMISYLQTLQQGNGLFHHTRESRIHWCRGNGWVATGMAELLLDLPAGTSRTQVMDGYVKMMAALKQLQIPDGQQGAGLWRQVIDFEHAWFETSCSAMFTYSIATGVNQGWLPAAEYATVARRGWLGITGQLDSEGNLRSICEGTWAAPEGSAELQREFYLARRRGTGDLHGQAPVLWSATSFVRANRCGR